MKQINVKKLIIPNIPYVFIALLATKLGQAARLAPGADFSAKVLHIMDGMKAAFSSILPSFHPIDLCVPQRAEPYSIFLRYFLAFLPLKYTMSRIMTAAAMPTHKSRG